MADKENSIDHPEFDIFPKFFEKIFGFRPELKDWIFGPQGDYKYYNRFG